MQICHTWMHFLDPQVMTQRELALAGLALAEGRALIIAANKVNLNSYYHFPGRRVLTSHMWMHAPAYPHDFIDGVTDIFIYIHLIFDCLRHAISLTVTPLFHSSDWCVIHLWSNRLPWHPKLDTGATLSWGWLPTCHWHVSANGGGQRSRTASSRGAQGLWCME